MRVPLLEITKVQRTIILLLLLLLRGQSSSPFAILPPTEDDSFLFAIRALFNKSIAKFIGTPRSLSIWIHTYVLSGTCWVVLPPTPHNKLS